MEHRELSTAAPQRPKAWRRKKLINPPLQLKMVCVFLALSLAGLATFGWLSAVTTMRLTTALSFEQADFARQALLQNFVGTLVVLIPVTVVVGVLVTFRVAGPAYRMEKHLDEIIAGKNPGACRIRQRDEFQSLCRKLNEACDALRAQQSQGSVPASAAMRESEFLERSR
ncbi:MAG: hypothetical protein ACKVX7_07915 [Planctomycetota bacterium]